MDAFLTAYKGLNAEQKRAVDTIEGPVIVIAGPGTGKTQILTLRIANILRNTDTSPEQILAITFTEAGVIAMRKRLVSIIGKDGHRVRIATFHGYCEEVIKRFPEYFPRIIGSKPITEIDQVALIEEVLSADTWNILKPWGDPNLYVRDILSAISELKREGFRPDAFIELVSVQKAALLARDDLYYDKGAHKGKMKGAYVDELRVLEKNEELSRAYKSYESLLARNRSYDFGDMILEVMRAMEQEETLALLLQEESQYLLIDEHQDTNNAQNRIIELLASFHENPNLFVVGDEKQAIFRFQGASLENFHYFTHKYKQAVSITLRENYRSAASILSTADALIEGTQKLQGARGVEGRPIEVVTLSTEEEEHNYIANEITTLLKQEIAPHDIAILYRNNKEGARIGAVLAAHGIPYVIESDLDLLKDGDIRTLFTILEAVHQYGNIDPLVRFLHLPLLGIHPLDVYRIIQLASQKRIYSAIDIIIRDDLRKELKALTEDKLIAAGKLLQDLHALSQAEPALVVSERAFRTSNLLEVILKSPDREERLAHITAFFDFLMSLEHSGEMIDLKTLFKTIETMQTHGLLIKIKRTESVGKVRLMTAHKSKGLEFPYVFIAHVVQGVWGGKRIVERLKLIPQVYLQKESSVSENTEGDERRLLYVALTRAKEHAVLTLHERRADGKEVLPSTFIHEIEPILLEERTHSYTIESRYDKPVLTDTYGELPDIRAFVVDLFEKKPFSVSALNNYIACPWKYFYTNLLRLPTIPTIQQHYGQAIHKALEQFFRKRMEESIDSKFLNSAFEKTLRSLPLSRKDEEVLLERGTHALTLWYEHYKDHPSWNIPARFEYMMRNVFIDDIELMGIFDRIEFITDTSVHIIDYKTGKPKTRKQIETQSDGVEGNYFRQLTFYKLLTEAYQEGRFTMESAELHFVEPDEKGRFHAERICIDTDAVHTLTETLHTVFNEIRTLSFWDRYCGEAECEFCELKRMMHTAA